MHLKQSYARIIWVASRILWAIAWISGIGIARAGNLGWKAEAYAWRQNPKYRKTQ